MKELDFVREFDKAMHKIAMLEHELKGVRKERDQLRDAMPDGDKLIKLAAWIDLKYPNDNNTEVQKDLRRWAYGILALKQEEVK